MKTKEDKVLNVGQTIALFAVLLFTACLIVFVFDDSEKENNDSEAEHKDSNVPKNT